MKDHYLLAIDQGTTGSTALVIRCSGRDSRDQSVIGKSNVEFAQHFPKPGWVEHRLEEIWSSVAEAVKIALNVAEQTDRSFSPKSLLAIGITNQRETLCFFDRRTGAEIRPAIVWQCRRSADWCERLRQDGHADAINVKTGLVLDPYFSGTKLAWVLENEPETAAKIHAGNVGIGTIDTFLMHRLTGLQSYATEASNASRTMLFDIRSGRFDEELCGLMGLKSMSVLPNLCSSAGEFGKTKGLGFLPDGIPITGVLGDQQAALAGQACFEPGEAKCTYGTGAFLLMNIGSTLARSSSGLLSTVAWDVAGKLTYAFEGSSFIAGAAVQFLRDRLKLIKSASDTEMLAANVQAAPELYFVPALTGLGAPYWNPHVRGAFFGLTRGTSSEQIVRAALEAIALQVCDLIDCMQKDSSAPLCELRVDGGAAGNDVLMQIQADYAGVAVDRPRQLESTAFGASLFAGLGCGLYASIDELRQIRQSQRSFKPRSQDDSGLDVQSHKEGWRRAIAAATVFSRPL